RLGIPVVFLHDVPGFLIGRDAERQGILGHAMDYIRALAATTVPKVSLVLRKSYGLGYFAMAGPAWGSDFVAALASAPIAVMGQEPGINLVYAKKLAQIEDPAERERMREALNAEWSERAEPWEAAYLASIDDLIEPAEARATLCRALHSLATTGPGTPGRQ